LIDNHNESFSCPEVQGRLDDLFKSNEKTFVDRGIELYPDDYPLIELKSLVLSLDWEITDEIITDFMMHTDNLIEFYRNDKVILKFLHILRALGKYIDANRSKAHPDCFKILNSVFFALDDVILTKDISRSETEKLLKIEIENYKKLRKLVSNRKLTKSREKEQYSLTKNVPKIVKDDKIDCFQVKSESRMLIVSQKQLNDLKNDIKQFIHSEFIGLRDELKNLK
jgi:hypothetical protein